MLGVQAPRLSKGNSFAGQTNSKSKAAELAILRPQQPAARQISESNSNNNTESVQRRCTVSFGHGVINTTVYTY